MAATSHPEPFQVDSYFVGQYYQLLQQQPDLVHQFYSDESTVVRVDGDSSESASSMLEIHTLVMLLTFTAIEVMTINSLDSWNGGVLVMVSGSVKIKYLNGRRKFVQTFLLALQEKGYFVLSDILQFIDDGMTSQIPASTLQENKVDAQLNMSSAVAEPPFSDFVLEEEAREFVNSVHIDDDPVDKYSLLEQPQEEDFEAEVVVEEAPAEETPATHYGVVITVQETPDLPLEEPVGEAPRKTYASIDIPRVTPLQNDDSRIMSIEVPKGVTLEVSKVESLEIPRDVFIDIPSLLHPFEEPHKREVSMNLIHDNFKGQLPFEMKRALSIYSRFIMWKGKKIKGEASVDLGTNRFKEGGNDVIPISSNFGLDLIKSLKFTRCKREAEQSQQMQEYQSECILILDAIQIFLGPEINWTLFIYLLAFQCLLNHLNPISGA
ncbi:hypothetical protein F3Y22_tig00112673pilonHSYRG00032 [Hibiscus syriacus]|uniref:NTF2 domain-containing protein n=1 Tax=Hibiscus syriacus TaxID=106335 RepID=A0A6A2WUG9_HIBSY|nr:hypothetical protein F3Y22_tig00112673pilonHSYRG00032 [Hibiscus syriacus]